MKIVFLITATTGFFCGVKDYTQNLVETLGTIGVTSLTDTLPTWSWKALFDLRRKYKNQRDIAFHLQYPSFGIGNSISPAFLPLFLMFAPFYLTLHEFSVFHPLRKLIFLTHSIFAKKIILTNEYERTEFLKYYSWAAGKTAIVPIGSNISLKETDLEGMHGKQRLVYFGQISEKKGIEFFIEVARKIRDKNLDVDITMIGSINDDQSTFARMVKDAAERYNIQLLLTLPPDEVSRALQKSTLALLPFPDGITEKRGSALACLKHGNGVITLHTIKTPVWLRKTTYHAGTPDEAVDLIQDFAKGEKATMPHIPLLEKELVLREWDNIALMHAALYQKA